MKVISVVSALFLLACLTGAVFAGEYYVAQKNPAADDGNPGTADKPFKTITAALPKLKAGDTLTIKQGVYRECVYLGRGEGKWGTFTLPAMAAGTPGRPICVVAAPGENVVVSAGEPITGWAKYKDAIYVKENWTDNTHQVFCERTEHGLLVRQKRHRPGRPRKRLLLSGPQGKEALRPAA
jgi:hypothetical protein